MKMEADLSRGVTLRDASPLGDTLTDEARVLVRQMVEWFFGSYEEDPAGISYYDGLDEPGCSCGEPCDVHEEIGCAFVKPEIFSNDEWEEIVSAAVDEIERRGGPAWVKIRHADLPLLRAHDHPWGRGHVHGFEADLGKTLCGRTPETCPGKREWGSEGDISCKACLRALARRKERWKRRRSRP
jgi:hypothetical protein